MANTSDTHSDLGAGSGHDVAAAAGAHAEVPAAGGQADAHGGGHDAGSPAFIMPILVWVTFGLLLAVLYKFAWKPILEALDQRESDIRRAVDDADELKRELAAIEDRRTAAIEQADATAKEIVSTARRAATDAGTLIEDKARDEAKILLENANREIGAARDKAAASLRQESAETAIALAGKILEENLDDEKNRALVKNLINQI
jgi:F-type H+-transporting ATPase subunit b